MSVDFRSWMEPWFDLPQHLKKRGRCSTPYLCVSQPKIWDGLAGHTTWNWSPFPCLLGHQTWISPTTIKRIFMTHEYFSTSCRNHVVRNIQSKNLNDQSLFTYEQISRYFKNILPTKSLCFILFRCTNNLWFDLGT